MGAAWLVNNSTLKNSLNYTEKDKSIYGRHAQLLY